MSMDTNNTLRIHVEDLQRKIHDAQVDADKKQELLIQTRMELDHMHHKIGKREEREVRGLQELVSRREVENLVLSDNLEAMQHQCNPKSPQNKSVLGKAATLARFPPSQDKEIEGEVDVKRIIALAWVIRVVCRAEVKEPDSRLGCVRNVLSPPYRTSAKDLNSCLERYTRETLLAAQRKVTDAAFERGLREGIKRWWPKK